MLRMLRELLLFKTFVMILFFGIGVSFSGCDWIHFAFMNSIPIHSNPSKNPVIHVYLGIDGLSYHSVQEVQKQGLFKTTESGGDWRFSKLIANFPATSDYAWTRLLHTAPIGGYELEYYDPTQDKVINKGMLGVLKHVMPTLAETFSFEAKHVTAWDFHAHGYGHSLHAYRDTYVSAADTLDELFFLLDGHSHTQSSFSAYMLEIDVLGHMQSRQDVGQMVAKIAKRIEEFRANHKDRTYHFTLFSDHGLDFVKVAGDHLIEFDEELRKVGVTPVETLWGRDPKKEIVAIPIMHTRVTYIALHTYPELVEEVSGRISRMQSVDFATSRAQAPKELSDALKSRGAHLSWYSIWGDGKELLRFAFDDEQDRYIISSQTPQSTLQRLGMDSLKLSTADGWSSASDDEIFSATRNSKYPDILYRTRSSLVPVGAKFAADILVSFKMGYASMGFKLPGGSQDIASSGFHGNLEDLGSLGTLLTTERELPDAVRADNLLELFPGFRSHLKSRKTEFFEGDKNAGLSTQKAP